MDAFERWQISAFHIAEHKDQTTMAFKRWKSATIYVVKHKGHNQHRFERWRYAAIYVVEDKISRCATFGQIALKTGILPQTSQLAQSKIYQYCVDEPGSTKTRLMYT